MFVSVCVCVCVCVGLLIPLFSRSFTITYTNASLDLSLEELVLFSLFGRFFIPPAFVLVGVDLLLVLDGAYMSTDTSFSLSSVR